MFCFNHCLQLCSQPNPACTHSMPSVLCASVLICKCWLMHACVSSPPAPPPLIPPLQYVWWLVSCIRSLAQKYRNRVVTFICKRPFFFFVFFHDMWLTTSGVHVWFIVVWQTWGNTTVSDPVGIFMSSAYKADFGYYGKSSKNSWNWRYAAWRLWVFQRSEIFLNFATQPSLPITAPPPTPLHSCPDSVSRSSPYCHCLQRRTGRKRGSSSQGLSCGVKMSEIWDQRCMIPRLGMWPPRA